MQRDKTFTFKQRDEKQTSKELKSEKNKKRKKKGENGYLTIKYKQFS